MVRGCGQLYTNNALESHNGTKEKKITLGRRLPLNEILVAMEGLTSSISLEFSNGLRVITNKPTIKDTMMKTAALMCQNNFKCFMAKRSMSGGPMFLVPSEKCDESLANEKYYRSLLKRQWNSFDEFVNYGFQKFYIVQISTTLWNQ